IGERTRTIRVSRAMRVHTQSFYTGRWILNQRRTKICDLVRRDSFARQACLNASAVGSRVHAGLYFPAGYVSGRKYPLVVQTHGFDPKSFWIVVSFTTALARQALAS